MLKKSIQACISGQAQNFFQRLHQKYPHIPTREMTDVWKHIHSKKKQASTSPSKRFHCYHLFLREQRKEILQKSPHLSFGEVSREVAKQWRAQDEASKSMYRKRAKLLVKYHHHPTWIYYNDRPTKYVAHMARNWFEDDVELNIEIHESMSKEEIIELLILHPPV